MYARGLISPNNPDPVFVVLEKEGNVPVAWVPLVPEDNYVTDFGRNDRESILGVVL